MDNPRSLDMGNPEVAKLIQNLKSSDWTVRRDAAKGLGEVSNVSVLRALLEELKVQCFGDTDSTVRLRAAIALGEAAVPVLIETLKDENREVRAYAAIALGTIGEASAVPALIETLKDEESSVRYHAVSTLGKIEDVLAVSALIRALKDKDKWVRVEAAQALRRIGDEKSLPRKILVASHLSVPRRIQVLDELRRVRYRDKYPGINLFYNFPEPRTLCQIVLQEDDAAARMGAQAVIDWLNGRDLLRPAQRDTAREPQELLRATQKETAPVQPETLLRQSSALQASADKPAPRRSLRERLFGR